jgi:hypothetical protein
MSEKNDTDIETIRLRMRPLPERIRGKLADLFNSLFHRDWAEAVAVVTDCTPIHRDPLARSSRYLDATIGGYVVGFTYIVNGKTYGGITNSPVEVQKSDEFAIRYSPQYPEVNNAFGSETNWMKTYTKYFAIILVLTFLIRLSESISSEIDLGNAMSL